MENKLYGDGIHDDYPAIQEMLDSRTECVYLPPAKEFYQISKCLKIHSNQELRLERFTKIRLADDSNCAMLQNADPENWDENICVRGGIWDMNHSKQWPNPHHYENPVTHESPKDFMARRMPYKTTRLFLDAFHGHCFIFTSIRNFTFKDITIVNPVVYGCQMAYIEQFTVENITFDYTEGSPKLWNMDGVHIEGGCRNGVIRNLHGACHDDLVAITADDGKYGEIENITVDGIYANGCHSAVRLLSWHIPLRNIHISNIYGTYYVYCITMSKYVKRPTRGTMDNITIDNIYASFCKGTVDVKGGDWPFITIGEELDIKNLTIRNVYRNETYCNMPTIRIDHDTVINNMHIYDCEQENHIDEPINFLENSGTINNFKYENVYSDGKEIKLN